MPAAHDHGAAGLTRRAKPRWEVADILRLHGEAYRGSHPMPLAHLKIMRALSACRTPALGGHAERCDSCGFERQSYNSCRNRHCPKCQSLAKARWLEARASELLPVGYFHVVFTLPHELNPLILCNKAVALKILFDAVSQTLLQFGSDPRNGLGGKIGFLTVLHTWDQKLLDHFHLHCLVPAGALSPDGRRWIAARENFLFPVLALGKVFRGKFIAFMKRDFAEGRFIFPGRTAGLRSPTVFADLIGQLFRKNWVVYCKPPFGGPQKVLEYLGRYTHRVAISNHRIQAVENGDVRFSYRDRRDGDTVKAMTIRAEEFIRRFLLHALPPSFMRIRHFGFLANRSKGRDLPRCRELLGLPPELPEPPPLSAQERLQNLTGKNPAQCPACETGVLRVIAELPRLPMQTWPHFPFTAPRFDTS
jgi:predicted Zn-ribbon and HTH transcriptional regulator